MAWTPRPSAEDEQSWSTFLRAHWGDIAATDFFTVEVVTLTGLVCYYVLFVIELKTRRVVIAGIVQQPFDAWMANVARGLIRLLGRARTHGDASPPRTSSPWRCRRFTG